MTKYLYILALAALFFVSPISAQTVTRPLTLTLDADKVDVIKLWIAKRDDDSLTVTEADISNAAGLAWIQDRMDELVLKLQTAALRHAIELGRTDIVPADVLTGVGTLQTAQDTQDSLEAGGTGVQ